MSVDGESQTLKLQSNPESISVVERMIDDVRSKLEKIPTVIDTDIELVFDPEKFEDVAVESRLLKMRYEG